MKRYNQGFLKFGPMEQCSSGEWVRYKDHENALNGYMEKLTDSEDKAKKLEERRSTLDKLYYLALEEKTLRGNRIEALRKQLLDSMLALTVVTIAAIYLGAKVAGLL